MTMVIIREEYLGMIGRIVGGQYPGSSPKWLRRLLDPCQVAILRITQEMYKL